MLFFLINALFVTDTSDSMQHLTIHVPIDERTSEAEKNSPKRTIEFGENRIVISSD